MCFFFSDISIFPNLYAICRAMDSSAHRYSTQQQRIATETTSEEIEARRARDRRNHMDLKTDEVPLFQQTCVHFKMRQLHSRLKCLCS